MGLEHLAQEREFAAGVDVGDRGGDGRGDHRLPQFDERSDAADHGPAPVQRLSQGGDVGHRDDLPFGVRRQGRQLLGVAAHGHHLGAAREQFPDHQGAGVPGGPDDGEAVAHQSLARTGSSGRRPWSPYQASVGGTPSRSVNRGRYPSSRCAFSPE